MSRGTLATNRILAGLLGLLLLAAGVALFAWWNGQFPGLPQKIDMGGLGWLPQQGWWPWALGAAGAILALIGFRWLAAHLPNRGVGHLNLTGSNSDGKLLVDAGAVVAAAAEAFQETPGVRSANGTIQRDRGQLVARLTATIEREADLPRMANAADAVSTQLQQALQRQDLHCRVQLRTAGQNRSQPRVQ